MPKLRKWGAATRLEVTSEGGVPDILYAINNTIGMIETKVTHTNGLLYFEKFQIPWMARHWQHCPRHLWVLVLVKTDVHLYTAGQIIGAPRLTNREWTVVAVNNLPLPVTTTLRLSTWHPILEALLTDGSK